MAKTFSAQRFRATRKTLTLHGQEYSAEFVGGGFWVKYKVEDGRLLYSVKVDDHGLITEAEALSGMTPSSDMAQMHAEGAFRRHFDHWSGEIAVLDIEFCKCAYNDPRAARKALRAGKPLQPDRPFTPVPLKAPKPVPSVSTPESRVPKEALTVVCHDCNKEFKRKSLMGIAPKQCPKCKKAEDDRRAAEQVAKMTCTCAQCNREFIRKNPRGTAPKTCYECKDAA